MKWFFILFLSPVFAFAQATSDSSFCGITRTTTTHFTALSNHTYDALFIDAGNTNNNCIDIPNGTKNVTITHCYLKNSHKATGAIHIGKDCKNITIMYNRIDSSYRGVNIVNSGNVAIVERDTNIHINYNRFYNIKDAAGHPNGGGSHIQWNNITGPGNQMNYNDCLTTVISDDVGDILSFYQSNGTPTSQMQCIGNCIEGGSTLDAGKSAFIGGDVGGSWQVIEYNICVNSGAQGGQLVGGNNIRVSYNKAFGVQTAYTYEGFASGNFGGGTPFNDTVSFNRAKWFNRSGSRLDFYYSSGGGNPLPQGWASNVSDDTLSAALLPIPLFGIACTAPGSPSVTYSPSSIIGNVGEFITAMNPVNTGGVVTSWGISPSLPTGLVFNTANGQISGVPTGTSSGSYTITASNGTGSSMPSVSITINAASAYLVVPGGTVKLQ